MEKGLILRRDDVLAIIKVKESGRTAKRVIKPRLNKVFNSEDLKITIEPARGVLKKSSLLGNNTTIFKSRKKIDFI